MRFNIGYGRLLSTTTLATGIYLAAAGMALSEGSSPSNTPTCQNGEVYNSSTKKCEQRHSGALPDKDLADYAYALAKAKRYDEALEVLNLMKNPNTAQALNYRGYATRHMGKLDEGIGWSRPSRWCKSGWSLRWPLVRPPWVEVSPDRRRSAAA